MTTSDRFRRWRRAAFAAQALAVLGLPFVQVGGESALRFDVPSLTLHAFGAALQIDELFTVLAFVLAASFAFLLATVVLGRAWCGWACPQTALLEVLAWSPSRPRWARPALAGVASAVVAANLLWYFVTPRELAARLASGSLGPVLGGAWLVLGATVFLFLGVLRHRWCATTCPYAKMQGAIFDRHTLVVAYDGRRAADCVQCRACVRACPVDIDIRDGLQAECIACAQCADACGPIMTRLGKANLVGYSLGEPGTGRRIVRPLVVGLALLTAASTAAFAASVRGRTALDLGAVATVPGTAARRAPDGRTLNFYELSLTNRGRAPMDVALALAVGGAPASLQPGAIRLAPGEHRQVRVLAAARLPAGSGPLPAELVATVGGDDPLRMTRPVTFVPPDPGGIGP